VVTEIGRGTTVTMTKWRGATQHGPDLSTREARR
jgi:hypothetical protein